jgi:hypothetical protein
MEQSFKSLDTLNKTIDKYLSIKSTDIGDDIEKVDPQKFEELLFKAIGKTFDKAWNKNHVADDFTKITAEQTK